MLDPALGTDIKHRCQTIDRPDITDRGQGPVEAAANDHIRPHPDIIRNRGVDADGTVVRGGIIALINRDQIHPHWRFAWVIAAKTRIHRRGPVEHAGSIRDIRLPGAGAEHRHQAGAGDETNKQQAQCGDKVSCIHDGSPTRNMSRAWIFRRSTWVR